MVARPLQPTQLKHPQIPITNNNGHNSSYKPRLLSEIDTRQDVIPDVTCDVGSWRDKWDRWRQFPWQWVPRVVTYHALWRSRGVRTPPCGNFLHQGKWIFENNLFSWIFIISIITRDGILIIDMAEDYDSNTRIVVSFAPLCALLIFSCLAVCLKCM